MIVDPLSPSPEQVKALLEAENRRLEQKRYHSDSNACRTMQAMVEQLTPKAATAPAELRTLLEEQMDQVRENCGGWGDHAMPWRLLAEAAYVMEILEREGAGPAAAEVRRQQARHKENRADKARIQDWYRENHHRYRSKNKAAEAAFVTGLVDQSYETIRKYLKNI